MKIIDRIINFINEARIENAGGYQPKHDPNFDRSHPPGYSEQAKVTVLAGKRSKGGHNDPPKGKRPPDPPPIGVSDNSETDIPPSGGSGVPDIERLDKQELNIHGFDKTRRVYIRGYFDITRGLPSHKSRRRKKYL